MTQCTWWHCRNHHIPENSWKWRVDRKVCWLAKLQPPASYYLDTNETLFLHPAVETVMGLGFIVSCTYILHVTPIWPVKLLVLPMYNDIVKMVLIIYYKHICTIYLLQPRCDCCTHHRCWYPHWNSTHQKHYTWLITNRLKALCRFESNAPFAIYSPYSTPPLILQAPIKAIHTEACGSQHTLLIQSFASLTPPR